MMATSAIPVKLELLEKLYQLVPFTGIGLIILLPKLLAEGGNQICWEQRELMSSNMNSYHLTTTAQQFSK